MSESREPIADYDQELFDWLINEMDEVKHSELGPEGDGEGTYADV